MQPRPASKSSAAAPPKSSDSAGSGNSSNSGGSDNGGSFSLSNAFSSVLNFIGQATNTLPNNKGYTPAPLKNSANANANTSAAASNTAASPQNRMNSPTSPVRFGTAPARTAAGGSGSGRSGGSGSGSGSGSGAPPTAVMDREAITPFKLGTPPAAEPMPTASESAAADSAAATASAAPAVVEDKRSAYEKRLDDLNAALKETVIPRKVLNPFVFQYGIPVCVVCVVLCFVVVQYLILTDVCLSVV